MDDEHVRGRIVTYNFIDILLDLVRPVHPLRHRVASVYLNQGIRYLYPNRNSRP
jgi:hypothetical protein